MGGERHGGEFLAPGILTGFMGPEKILYAPYSGNSDVSREYSREVPKGRAGFKHRLRRLQPMDPHHKGSTIFYIFNKISIKSLMHVYL